MSQNTVRKDIADVIDVKEISNQASKKGNLYLLTQVRGFGSYKGYVDLQLPEIDILERIPRVPIY